MALIKINEVIQGTSISGNIDVDKINPIIRDVEALTILPLIGQTLYDEINLQLTNSTLTTLNEALLNGYLKPILKYQSCAEIIEISAYVVANGGVFKHTPKDAEVVSKSEIQYLAQIYRGKAQAHIQRCELFLCRNGLQHTYSYGINDIGVGGFYVSDLKLSNPKTSGGWFL